VSDLLARAVGDAATSHRPDVAADTAQRLRDTDEELRRAGIEPGDATLYRAPTDGETP
jgi:hypothetical protein